MDRPLLHRRARAAQGRPQEIQATKALPAVARPPVGAGGRMAGPRLVAAAHQRQAARPVAGRCAHARVPGDHLPMGLLQQAASGTLGAVPAARAQRRRRHGGRRTSRFPIPGRVPISERPPEADGRSAFGHWEADSVIGVGCNLHTEVERRTRFLMARIVPDKTAGESVGAQLAMFSPLPAGARVSVTHDNGTEFAHHERLRDGLGMATYFADPYSSWQRGKQREPQRHDPPVSAQTLRDPDGHGKGGQGDRRRDQQPPHARAGLPDARRGVRRRTVRITGPTRVLHF